MRQRNNYAEGDRIRDLIIEIQASGSADRVATEGHPYSCGVTDTHPVRNWAAEKQL
jgi:hypothetical protein